MSDRRIEKLSEKYAAKQAWKKDMEGLLNRTKKAEAQVKDASEIIAKVQKSVKDAFDSADAQKKLSVTLAKIVGVKIPEKPEPAEESKEA